MATLRKVLGFHASNCAEKSRACCRLHPVLDLPLCFGVLKHRASLARGGSSSCQNNFYDGFLLMWCNFKFKGVLFRSDSRHNDRVDSILECATKQAVMTMAQWHRSEIILGASGYWQKKVEDVFMHT